MGRGSGLRGASSALWATAWHPGRAALPKRGANKGSRAGGPAFVPFHASRLAGQQGVAVANVQSAVAQGREALLCSCVGAAGSRRLHGAPQRSCQLASCEVARNVPCPGTGCTGPYSTADALKPLWGFQQVSSGFILVFNSL